MSVRCSLQELIHYGLKEVLMKENTFQVRGLNRYSIFAFFNESLNRTCIRQKDVSQQGEEDGCNVHELCAGVKQLLGQRYSRCLIYFNIIRAKMKIVE